MRRSRTRRRQVPRSRRAWPRMSHTLPNTPLDPCLQTPPARPCRPKRAGEVEGRDYFFVSKDKFEGWIADNMLLEYAVVYGEYKGIPRQQVRPREGVRAGGGAGADRGGCGVACGFGHKAGRGVVQNGWPQLTMGCGKVRGGRSGIWVWSTWS